jgi:hypothetical protein
LKWSGLEIGVKRGHSEGSYDTNDIYSLCFQACSFSVGGLLESSADRLGVMVYVFAEISYSAQTKASPHHTIRHGEFQVKVSKKSFGISG